MRLNAIAFAHNHPHPESFLTLKGVRPATRVSAIVVVAVLIVVTLEPNVWKDAVIPNPYEPSASSAPSDPSPTNETPEPPPPPPPPDPPPTVPVGGEPVAPGEVFQAWDNSSLAPSPLKDVFPIQFLSDGDRVVYYTPYGEFTIERKTPHIVSLRRQGESGVTSTQFTVKYTGALLNPRNGTIAVATADTLVLRYIVGAEPLGTLEVVYLFKKETNKIGVVFTPGKAAKAEFSQVVWLTHTTYKILETIDLGDEERDLTETELAPVGIGEFKAKLKPGRGDRGGVLLDFSDAKGEWDGLVYAGKHSFDNRSGNWVMVSFLPGRVKIDPTFLAVASSSATAYSIQRKTLFDGERYFAFWYDNGIRYRSSADGRSWSATYYPFSETVPACPDPACGFTVTHFGKTVAVLWIDSTKTYVRLATGQIMKDWIRWDPGQPRTLTWFQPNTVVAPIAASFTPQGELVATYVVTTGAQYIVRLVRYICNATNGYPCSETTTPVRDVQAGQVSAYAPVRSVPVAFNGDAGYVAVVYSGADGAISPRYLRVYVEGPRLSGSQSCTLLLNDPARGFDESEPADYFAASASGKYVAIVWKVKASSRIAQYSTDASCLDVSYDTDVYDGSFGSPQYITAGIEQDGKSLYVFFTAGVPNKQLRYARVVPRLGGPIYILTPAWSFPGLVHITTSFASSRFMPVLFVYGTDVYQTLWPLPIDNSLSPQNPWTGIGGAPVVSDLGGKINPATGLLIGSQDLVNIPGRRTKISIAVLYRQPGLFWSSTNSVYRFYNSHSSYGYVVSLNGNGIIHLDLPWIDIGSMDHAVHLPGGQAYIIRWDNPGGIRWFNNTAGIHFKLKYINQLGTYFLTMPSGEEYVFGYDGRIQFHYQTSAHSNHLAFNYVGGTGLLDFIVDDLGNQISFTYYADSNLKTVTYGGSRVINFAPYGGVPSDCTGGTTTDSATLTITDVLGRKTVYYVCKYLLSRVSFPTGAKIVYTYGQLDAGSDTYSQPVTKVDSYNESGANRLARSTTLGYRVQNGEIVFAEVKSYDGLGVYQGTKEYRYKTHLGLATTRILDGSGQILHYDMETLQAPNQLKDLSGNGNHGSMVGTSTLIGRFGQARYLPSINDRISKPSFVSPTLTQLAASAWGKLNSLSSASQVHTILSDASQSISAGFVFFYNDAADPRNVKFQYATGSAYLAATWTGVISDTNWHHYALVADYSADNVELFVDGISRGKMSIAGALAPPLSGRTLYVGSYNTALHPYVGSLDEIRVYSRPLTSEEATLLYSLNAIQRKMQNSWYSANDQPHMLETLVGDETEPSSTTLDFADDWGNIIYVRDPSGNETFSSFANTNHQYHFYAPGSLSKTATGKIYETSFDQYVHDWSTISGTPSALLMDDATSYRYAPSLRVTATSAVTLERRFASTTGSDQIRLLELNVRKDALGALSIILADSAGAIRAAVRFADMVRYVTESGTSWSGCWWPNNSLDFVYYNANTWYRVSMYADINADRYHVYLNGVGICTDKAMPGTGGSIDRLRIQFVDPHTAWFDDVKVEKGTGIQISGLKGGQRAYLYTFDGRIINAAISTGASISLSFLFNARFEESGANFIRVFSADSTLEYQSPFKAIYGGDIFAYRPPRILEDELVRTRSGFGYWQTMYIDEPPTPGTPYCSPSPCNSAWSWVPGPVVSQAQAHELAFGYPVQIQERGGTGLSLAAPTTDQYHVQYVYFHDVNSGMQRPAQLLIKYQASGMWKAASWGIKHDAGPAGTVDQGPLPDVRNGWVQLIAKASDLGTQGYTVTGVGYETVGGQAFWDATALAGPDIGDLKITGLWMPGIKQVRLEWANNGTPIVARYTSGSEVSLPLYSGGYYKVRAFPIWVKITIFRQVGISTYAYHVSSPRLIWGGDVLTYQGNAETGSGFYDPGFVFEQGGFPDDDLHSVLLGTKTGLGDCLDARLCYDMQSVAADSTVTLGPGTVATKISDLSGNGNDGTAYGTIPSKIQEAAAGLGRFFNGVSDYIDIPHSSSIGFSNPMAVSFWANWATFPPGDGSCGPGGSSAIPLTKGGYTGSWWVELRNTGQLQFYLTFAGPVYVAFTWGNELTGQLHHYGATYDGQNVRLFKDGQLVSTTPETRVLQTTTSALSIGRGFGTGCGSKYTHSVIDQVLLYNKALGANEIAGVYHSRLPGARTAYLRPSSSEGFVSQAKVAYEGKYLAASFTHDSYGNLLSLSDSGELKAAQSGQVLYFDMESPTNMMPDLSGKGNDGEIFGTASIEGRWGLSRNFPGSGGDYVQVSDSSSLRLGTMTVSAWVKVNALVGDWTRVVGKGEGPLRNYGLWISPSGTQILWQIYWTDGTGSEILSSTPIGLGQWAHLLGTYDGQYLRLYINGQEVAPSPVYAAKVPRTSADPLTVGKAITMHSPINTVVDEAYVYNLALQPSRIFSLYSDGMNVTRNSYSSFYGDAFLTSSIRPDGVTPLFSYDRALGVRLGALAIDCRRLRADYDVAGRPVATMIYDADATVKMLLDMETPSSGSVLKDVSCSGNSATILGTSEVDGAQGKARDFSGTSGNYLRVTHQASLTPSTFTVAFWINPDVFPAYYGRIISKNAYNSPVGTYRGWMVLYNGQAPYGRIYMSVFNSANSEFASPQVQLTLGTWHHVAFTFDGTNIRAFLDGVEIGPGGTLTGTFATSTNDLLVGAGDSNGPTTFFDGKLDEVYFVNRAVTTPEVIALFKLNYKLGARHYTVFDDMVATDGSAWSGYEVQSVAEYDAVSIPRKLFSDMQSLKLSGTLEDLSGNGNHLTLVGTTSVAGKIGNARYFNGAEYARVSSDENKLDFSAEFTIAAWFYMDDVNNRWGVSKWICSATCNQADLSYAFMPAYGYTTGKPTIYIRSPEATSDNLQASTSLPTGVWRFIAATFDHGTLRLYVDGGSSLTTYTKTSTIKRINPSNARALVGAESSGAAGMKGRIDEVHLLARALSGTEIQNLYGSYANPSSSAVSEKSHIARRYFDGLGRQNRATFMDMFGNKIVAGQEHSWIDLTKTHYPPAISTETNKKYTQSYDFLGRLLTVTAPGDGGVTAQMHLDKDRRLELTDPLGRKSYSKDDLLGRTVETAIWNPAVSAYGNLTKTSYNAMGMVTRWQDAKGQVTSVYYDMLELMRFAIYPDGTTSSFAYDNGLRIATQSDAMGRVVTRTYDVLGRVTKSILKPSADSATAYDTTYVYDGSDNLKEINNVTTKVTRIFDLVGHLTQEVIDVPATAPVSTLSTSFGYDADGRLTSLTYPDGTIVTYYFDSLSRIIRVDVGVNSKHAELAYDAAGRLSSIAYYSAGTSTGLTQTYQYDARDRVTQIKVAAGATVHLQLDYSYNKGSETTQINDNAGTGAGTKIHTYYYDGEGRLSNAVGPWGTNEGSQTLEYSYDPVGNILRKTVDGVATDYAYGSGAAWNRLDSFGSTTFTYNAAGSILRRVNGGSTTDYTYDFSQRLVKIVSGANTHGYECDALGRRVKSVEPGGTGYFAYTGEKLLYVQKGSAYTRYVYVGDLLLLRKDSGLAVRFYHQDASLNVRLVTYWSSANAIAVEAKYRYRPFGEIVVLTSGTDPIRFAGRELDASGLYHMGVRYYDSVMGRFLSRDPLGSGYDYALNNPLSFHDPTGEGAFLVVIALLLLAAAAVTTAVVVSYAFPQATPYVDAIVTGIGFIPLFGDVFSTAYFLTQDAIECSRGRCDLATVGLDLLGAIPGVPNIGGGARTAIRAFGFLGMAGLVGRAGNRADDIGDLARIGGRLPNVIGAEGVQRTLLKYGDDVLDTQVLRGGSRIDVALKGGKFVEVKTGKYISKTDFHEEQLRRYVKEFGAENLAYEFHAGRVSQPFQDLLSRLNVRYYINPYPF